MNRPELRRQLQVLASRYPGIHPYTLALRFQALNGFGLACGLAVGPWLGGLGGR